MGVALAGTLPKLTPSVRARVLRTMLGRADWSPALVDALEQNQAKVSELALDQKQALATHPNREIAARARSCSSAEAGCLILTGRRSSTSLLRS